MVTPSGTLTAPDTETGPLTATLPDTGVVPIALVGTGSLSVFRITTSWNLPAASAKVGTAAASTKPAAATAAAFFTYPMVSSLSAGRQQEAPEWNSPQAAPVTR